MLVSTITTKGQATIPAEVRKKLNLQPGDVVLFNMDEDKISISKATMMDIHYYRGLAKNLAEWNSAADEEAYNDL